MERNAIVLVNIAPSSHLDGQAARVFAAMLINEFFEAALRRAGTTKHYFLLLDEFQEYITYDLAAMLDQVRKGGLHLVMAHQRFGHLDRDPELLDAMTANARITVLFGGLSFKSASQVANEHFLSEINERQIKATYYSRVIKDYEKIRVHSEGSSDSWSDNASEGETKAVGSTDRMGPDVYQQAAHSHHAGSAKGGAAHQSESEAYLPVFEDRVSSEPEWRAKRRCQRSSPA